MQVKNGLEYAEAICPFCGQEFDRPGSGTTVEMIEDYFHEHTSSCGCGARFCLEDVDEVGSTIRETEEQAEEQGRKIEIRTIPKFDYATFSGEEPAPHNRITAIFWKEV